MQKFKNIFYIFFAVICFFILINCQSQEKAWEKTKDKNTIQSYEEFLNDYPDSQYTETIKEKIKELKYDQVKKEDKLISYEKFLNTYPNSKYTEEFKDRIFTLSYEKAKKDATKKAYNAFLHSYPKSKYSDEIKNLLYHVATKRQLKNAISKPDLDSILILSIPSGKQIYFGPTKEKKEKKEKDGYVSIEKKHPIFNKKNLKGKTPLLLSDIQAGNYLIGISPIIVMDRNARLGGIDSTLNAECFIVFGGMPTTYPLPKKDYKGAAVYSIKKESLKTLQIIVIAYSANTTLKKLKNLYPADEVFEFNEKSFLKDLKIKTSSLYTKDQSKDIVALLRRGGKIVFSRGDIKIIMEIKTDKTWKIKAYVRLKK